MAAMYFNGRWITGFEDALARGGLTHKFEPTHWMPMPSLPKKEALAGEDRGQGGEIKETTTKNESSV